MKTQNLATLAACLFAATAHATPLPFPAMPSGENFRVQEATYSQEGNYGSMSFVIHNRSGHTISPNIVRSTGAARPCNDLPNGRDCTFTEAIQTYHNGAFHVDRWAPGFMGVMGTGGGRVDFQLPSSARSARIALIVVH